jgi:hypothetical protein
MGGTRVIPTEVSGANVYALADQRKRAAEDKCADLVDSAYRWLDRRPGLAELMADPAFELFAAQAITLRRLPEGLSADEGEAWLVAGWQARAEGRAA